MMCLRDVVTVKIISDFVTFILRPNTALDHQTFHAEPQSLLSRGDDTCERLRSLRGLRPFKERVERLSRSCLICVTILPRMWRIEKCSLKLASADIVEKVQQEWKNIVEKV